MVTKQLTHPGSIVVVGGSENIQKPGGKILKNLIDGNFKGDLYVLNPKADTVQGIISYKNPDDMPDVDLAIIAIAAKYTPDTVDFLTQKKNTKAIIILSAGFSEESAEGKILEDRVVASVNKVGGSLIGPNCIGILTPQHHSVFTKPIPKLNPFGCDLISGSGATAAFIMEAGIPKGLQFANIFSVGNSAQLGVEEILKHMDENFNPETDSKVKLLYLENIDKPHMLLKHAISLIKKGCRIAAVKAGSSEAGSRAASSHTGALASPDLAVDALFKKAGIVRCYGREDLISVASVFMHPKLTGKNIAIITHAGGPAVMLTDTLSMGGLVVPHLEGDNANSLKEKLFPGSSVSNPIDFLATGTAEQLGIIIDYVDNKFDDIDAMVVIFGTPGLIDIFDVYELLDEKMKSSIKPIYPVLPSVQTASKEIEAFISKNRTIFTDEVVLGEALVKVHNTIQPSVSQYDIADIDNRKIRKVIDNSDVGYLSPQNIQLLLDAVGIARTNEIIVDNKNDALSFADKVGFPIVMKVVGPVHKSDVGGVVLNVSDKQTVSKEFDRLMKIKDTTSVLMYPMLFGTEVFIGAKREDNFGHLILCGLGGIFVEVLKDVSANLAPVSKDEAMQMIMGLKGYGIIKGVRNQEAVNEDLFAEAIRRVGALVQIAPEIYEMDLNPLLGTASSLTAVDARIRILK